MADRISSIYEKACAKGILDPQTQSEQWFREQLSTDRGIESFYNHATANGMKFHPLPEFKQRLTQPIDEQPTQPVESGQRVAGAPLPDEQQELERQDIAQGLATPLTDKDKDAMMMRNAERMRRKTEQMAKRAGQMTTMPEPSLSLAPKDGSVAEASKRVQADMYKEIHKQTIAKNMLDDTYSARNAMIDEMFPDAKLDGKSMSELTDREKANMRGLLVQNDPYLKAADNILMGASIRMEDAKRQNGVNFGNVGNGLVSFAKDATRHLLGNMEGTLSFGTSDLRDAMIQRQVLKKIADAEAYDNPEQALTPQELVLYDAIITNVAVEIARQNDTSRWSKAGQITADMIPFVADIMMGNALFKGLGNTARKAITKSVEKSVKNKLAKWLLINVPDVAISAGESALTATILPSTYAKMYENAAQVDMNKVGMDGDYRLKIGGVNQQSLGKSWAQAEGEQIKEIFTETGGNFRLIGRALIDNPIGKKILKTPFGMVLKRFEGAQGGAGSRFASMTMYHGVLGEWLEELEGAIYDGNLKEFFTADTQLPMLLSFSVPAAFTGGLNATQQAFYQAKYDQAGKRIDKLIDASSYLGPDKNTIKGQILATLYQTPTENLPQAIGMCVEQVYPEEYKALMEGAPEKGNKAAELSYALKEYLTSGTVLTIFDPDMIGGQIADVQAHRQQMRQQAEQNAQAEVQSISHEDGNIYRVGINGKDGAEGYAFRGNLDVVPNPDGTLSTRGRDLITIKMTDGTVEQVPADEVTLLDTPVSAAYRVQAVADHLFAQYANNDLFQIGDKVHIMQDGQPSEDSSTIVGINDEGVEVEIIDPNGQPNTTIIPHEQAAEMLSKDETGTEDGIVTFTMQDGNTVRLRDMGDGTFASIVSEGEQPEIFTEEELAEAGAVRAESQTDGLGSSQTEEQVPTYPTDETGNPAWGQMEVPQSAQVLYDLYKGNRDSAKAYADDQLKEAEKVQKAAAKQASHNLNLAQRIAEDEQNAAFKAAADAAVKYWQDVKLSIAQIKTAEEQAAKEAQQQMMQQAREQRSKTEEGTVTASTMAERYNAAPKIEGNTGTMTLPDGRELSGRYMLIAPQGVTPSHDVTKNFQRSEGYPVTSNGQSINDRDYTSDKEEQQKVVSIAQNFNGNAIKNMPVISDEGLVYNGNGRMMAGQLAAINGTDAAYMQSLMNNAAQYGFTPEQVASIPNARVVFQLDERLPYSTQSLAIFNEQETQTQSNTGKAAGYARKLTPQAVSEVLAAVDGFNTIDAFFSDKKAPFNLINSLINAGIIAQREKAEMVDGDKLSATGRERLSNILFGTVFDNETIRLMGDDAALKNSILRALPQILENKSLGEFSLESDINDAIRLLYQVRNSGMPFRSFVSQTVIAEDGQVHTAAEGYSPFQLLLAEEMSEGGVDAFRDVLTAYNNEARNVQGGQVDIFGDLLTPTELKNLILQRYGKEPNEQERPSASRQTDNSAEGTPASNEPAAEQITLTDGRVVTPANVSHRDFWQMGGMSPIQRFVFAGKANAAQGIETKVEGAGFYNDARGALFEEFPVDANGYSQLQTMLEAISTEYENEPNKTEDYEFAAQQAIELVKGRIALLEGMFKRENNNLTKPKNVMQLVEDIENLIKRYDENNYLGMAHWRLDEYPELASQLYAEYGLNSQEEIDNWITSRYEKVRQHWLNLPGNQNQEPTDNQASPEERLAQAEAETDTNPTEAQKKAENYKQGHVTLWGLPITIENPKGSIRRGTDANGKQWEQEMHHTYGKIRRTEGVDGDHIDVFIGPNLTSDKVFVVDQRNVDTGEFDEHKCMLGFDSLEDAQNGYLSNYEEGWQGMGTVTEVTMDEFKKWIDSSHRKTKPFAEYKSVKTEGAASTAMEEQPDITNESAQEFIGKDVADVRKALGHWWTLDSQNAGQYIFDRAGYGRLQLSTDEKGIVTAAYFVSHNGPAWFAAHPEQEQEQAEQVRAKHAFEVTISDINGFIDRCANNYFKNYALNNDALDTFYDQQVGKHIIAGAPYVDGAYILEVLHTANEELDKLKGKRDKYSSIKKRVFSNLVRDIQAGLSQPVSVGENAENSTKNAENVEQNLQESEKSSTFAGVNNNQNEPAPTKPKRNQEQTTEQLGTNNSEVVSKQPRNQQQANFESNSVFTADAVAEARKRLAARRNRLNMGLNPEDAYDYTIIAGAYVEQGVRKFADFCKAMIQDLGDAVRPYLQSIYDSLRHDPQVKAQGWNKDFDSHDIVDNFDVDNFAVEEEQPEEQLKAAFEVGQKVKYYNKVDKTYHDAEVESVNADGTYNITTPSPIFGDIHMNNISEDRLSAIEEKPAEPTWGDTPMGKQFKAIKEQYPDAMLIFRVGDFYELYDKDAEQGSKILGITLTKTSRMGGVRMAGFPFHALDTYLPKLVRAGWRVAICDQLEDPKLTTKTVKRGVTELVETPKVENAEVAEPKSVTDNQAPTIPEPNVVTDTIGEITESTHTKTGAPIWVVKPLERVSDAEFRVLRRRAKENNGYYSTFVKGYVFNSVNDANRFNNISDEQTTTEQTSADSEAAIRAGEAARGETASVGRDRGDQSRAEGEQRTEVSPASVGAVGTVTPQEQPVLSQAEADAAVTERQEAISKIDAATEQIENQLDKLEASEETTEEQPAQPTVLEQAQQRRAASRKKKAYDQQQLDLFAEEDSNPPIDEQTEPINNEDNGSTEVRNDGERESSAPQGRTAGQPADQNGTLGGSERQANEGTQSGGVGSRSEQHRVHDGERGLGTAGQRTSEPVDTPTKLDEIGQKAYEKLLKSYKPGLKSELEKNISDTKALLRGEHLTEELRSKLKGELKALQKLLDKANAKNTRNFRYDPADPAPTSNRARYEANLSAIRLLKQLQDEDRQATPEEQRVLAKFTGWGGLGEFFKGEPGTTYWSDHGEKSPYQVIKELLTDEEMQAAQLSRNSAYYTPAAIIDELWSIAQHLGFKGGNILEGSAGIGNILAQIPQSISDRSNLQAVEIDTITAGILAQLYPDAQVHAAGFQEVDIPNNSQDLVITNVPFVTGLRVYDKKEKDLSKRFGNIHDFCIAKNVRKLRQGGLGIFITTSGTLDSSKDLRRWLNNEGETDVIGAFRLNRETFGGTSATSDIIVVRKRVNGQKDPRAIDVLDTDVARVAETEEDGKNVEKKLIYNRYFVEHPESMGGEMGFGFEHGDTRWGGTTAGCYPSPSIDQTKRLQDWVESIPTTGEVQTITVRESNNINPGTYEEYHGELPYGSLVLNSKGEICRVYNGMVVPVEGINPTKVKGHTKAEVLTDYNALKAAVEELLAEQAKGISDEGLKGLLRKLNKAYDDFVKKYGYLNRNVSLSFLRNDVQWASMAALENVRETIDKSGKKKIEVGKTDVFSKRVVGVQAEPKAENARDGVILSVQQYGNVRPDMIATWLGRPQEEVEKEIIESRIAFRDPQTGNMVVSHEYLSGNVREKLAYAEEHNENGIYDTNIEELRKVIPVDIPAHLIEFNIGSTWIPVELYHQYLKEKFGVENLQLVHVGSAWISNEKSYGGYALRNEKNRAEGVYSEKLMEQVYGHQLMMAAMNNVPLVVSKVQKNYDGTTETITDKEATAACSDKISQIKDDFVEWARGKMQEDSELAERVQKIYNERFNAIVPMLSVDKAFLSPHLPGQNHKYTLYDHQQQAVVRATTQPVMLAHEVGTGKTITLISSAMEMRRLGTAKKPMIVVQNATTPQFVKEAKDLYPNAKILTVSERDRTKEGRQEFYAKIKYNDWDLIIVPQSVFDMIPDSESRMRDFIQEKIDEKMHAIEAAKEANVDAKVTKRMEKELEALQEDLQNANMSGKRSKSKTEKDAKKDAERIENAKARAEEMLDRRTDEVENFDDMGIDALLIDEAHNYKHLGFATMMTRGVKGIDPSYSKRAAALYLKCQSVYERCGHRNVVFATGTPISNTAAEIWTFMKYLMPKEVLKDNDIYYFDDFVHNFGKIAEQLEFATNGKFKANNRFAQYGNVPELMRIWLTCADCVLTREVGQVNDKVPELEGGKAQDIFLPQSPSLIDIMASVRAELERYEQMSGKEKKENSHIPLTMYGVAKRAAIDPRLVDANAADEPLSKTNKAVEETLRSLKETKKYNGTVAIFCDSYRNLQTGFNLFEDIKAKLVKAGVPAAKVAIIRSEMTDAAKQKIFDAVREGEIRVIMGSTQTLGTGVNIQTRLHTLIHMDAPDRPMDYTQRNGRIIRQGNMHRQWNIPVRVLRFGVEDSLDVTSYQRLKTKAGFIDSIMNGKSMIDNNLENRVLEDVEEGIFDNPVAMLSGSQYALLKSQAERDLRKWQARKQQHDIDQILIAKKLKDNAQIIERRRQLIATDEQFLQTLRETFPTGKVTEYNIDGTICHNAAELKEAVKAINADIQARADKLRKEGYEGSKQNIAVSLQFNGMPFNVNIVLTYKSSWEGGMRKITIDKEVQFTTPTTDKWLNSPTKVLDKLIEHIEQDYLSGTQATGEINYSRSYIERLQQENELMRQREGKPFEHSAELEKAQALVDEYTEKMQDELAEKEAKYANMSSGRAVTLNEQDDEEETTPEAQITNLDYPQFTNQTEAQQLATAALVEVLNDNTDLDVFLATDEEASQIIGDDNVEFSIRRDPAPKKTGIGYKVFYRGKDGKLYPPMVANPNGEATPVGVWLNADAAPVAGESKTGRPQVKAGGKGTQGGSGQLAYRPGWHLGEIPYALQFNRKDENGEKTLFPKDFVWAEVEYAADNDYQEEAMREGVNTSGKFQHSLAGLKHVPTDGFYRYRTNPNPATDPWIITGAMKVNRILTNEEVDEIVRAAGREPQRREGDVPELSFRTDRDGNPIGDGDWHMKFFVREFPEYPQISSRVDKSATTESVYVTYTNADNGRSVKVRFSGHRSNAERFGDVLTGGAPRGEILYRLGLATKEWQPFGYVPIGTISNKQIAEGNYEVADKTRAELERLPKGTDISEYKGKLVPGEQNRIYTGTFVGESQSNGIYIYKDANGNEIRGGLREAMLTPNGRLYGWAVGDKIYLTKDGLNPNSPIHEYSHIWAKAMMRNNREGWQSIVDIFKGTPFWDEVVNDPNYQGLTTDDAICSEVLARYSGQRGAERMEEWAKEEQYEADQSGSVLRGAKVRQLINRAKKALADFWHWVGVNLFGIKHFDSAEQVADRVLWDMLNGTELGDLSGNSNRYSQVATDAWNKYQYDGELESVRDVADYIDENMPKDATTQPLFDAIDKYRTEEEEDRMLYGERGDLEPFEDAIFAEIEKLMKSTDNTAEAMISGYTQEKQRTINEWYAAHPRPQYQRGETLEHYQARLEAWEKEYKAFRASMDGAKSAPIGESTPNPRGKDTQTPTGNGIQPHGAAPAFVPGVRPTPMANETPYEYSLRLRQYYQLMRDERLVAEYVAEINNQADAAAKVLKKNTIVRGLLDAAKPIENFQEWMKQRGATITDESNAYTDTFLATGRVTEANEQMQRDIIRPLAKQIAKIIAPDAKTGKSRLDGINIVWHNMDVAGTGSKLDGKALTPREIIGVYCQAKDCAEAIEKGLPDRGAKGFLNNLGMSHDDVIAAVESVIPRAELDELWRLINAATHFALNYDYESGRISEDTHTEFYQREFYVPQRGWRERDESGLITEYEPVGKRGNDPYNAALVKAHGRQSLASDPFAYIMSIDASSIVSSENNKIKQKFLQFCLDNENLGLQTGAFRVKKYWIMNVIDPETGKIKLDEEGNPMMEVSYVAPSAEDLSHDRTIKELIKKKRKEWAKVNQAYLERQSHGELGPQLEAAYKTKLSKIEQAIEDLEQQMHIAWHATNTNITQRTSDEKRQHEVRVLLDGQEYLIEVQDEKLANAINKKFKQHQEQLFNTSQKMRNATRFMSAVLTQYNPEFAASNFARDFQVALATLTAEHPELVGSFLKNFAACQPAVWQYAFNDKVRDRAVFRDSELGRYLQEYFKAGAATGFSYMQDLKSLRQDFDAMVNESNLRRGIKGAVGVFSTLTEVSETAVRFAGYVAARQKGMGINEAAYLSKELTTNFDRAGEVADSGWMSWFSFFRATLNGNIKFLKALKKMPLAYSLIAAAYVAMGMLNQFLNPDDPEDEVWAGDFTRESNFVIGKWRIPTAHFLRMFFAAGVNAAKWMQGEKSFGEATYNTATFATNELLPDYLNVMNWTDWDSNTGRMTMPWDGDNYKKGVRGFIPTPISPIADVWANRDFMGATINYPADDGKKDILRAKKKTLPIYQMLTQTIYDGVGGDMNTKRKSDDPAWRSWLFDTSASSVEHVVEGYMPAAMDMFVTLGEAIYDAATGTPTGPDKWPFVRKFYNAYTPERAYMQQYYLLNGRVKEFKRNMDDYRKNDRTKYNILTHSQEYRNYLEAERLVKNQIENPTTADVQALINANKQWIK